MAARRAGYVWWAGLAAACIVPALPLLLTEVPPLLDYPNHLARLYVLAVGGADPVLSRMVAPAWRLLPNLGTDAVMAVVLRVVPVHVAGRALLAAILALQVLGVAALSRANFGGRPAWALGAGLVTCHALFLMGFLNFDLALGLALLLAAAWIRFREERPVAVVAGCSLGVVVLFFCHLMGVLLFLLLAGAYEFERCWAERATGLWRRLVARGAAAAPVVVVPLALYLLTALQGVGGPTRYLGWRGKLGELFDAVVNYNRPLDVATAVALTGFLAWCAATRRLAAPVRSLVALGALVLLFLATPYAGKGLAYVDSRFSVMLGLALFALVRPVRLPRGVAVGAAVVAMGLLLVRTAVVATWWHDDATVLAEVRDVMAPVPPGAAVLEVYGAGDGDDAGIPDPARFLSNGQVMDYHRPALLLLERRAFWPHLFADPSQQPIRVLPPYDALVSKAAPWAELLSGRALSADEQALFPRWADWWRRFDYVLLLEAGVPSDPATVGGGRLELVRRNAAAMLFRVRPSG